MLATWPVDCIQFCVAGIPRPLARARFAHGRVYNPSSKDLQLFKSACAPSAPAVLSSTGPVGLDLVFSFARPVSHFGKSGLKATAPRLHMQTPDLDNLIKFVGDALNGLFYTDDKQIVHMTARKQWVDVEPSSTVVTVSYGVGSDSCHHWSVQTQA
jgi:Holliday junction resolvase RusA-like endonuclease